LRTETVGFNFAFRSLLKSLNHSLTDDGSGLHRNMSGTDAAQDANLPHKFPPRYFHLTPDPHG
jgi:hypothetical protein